jgi:hypothetical protein
MSKLKIYTGHTQKNGAVVIVNTIKTAPFFCVCPVYRRSWYSDSLRDGRSGDRIPVEARFLAAVQTGTGVHPASYTMGTGSFPGVKRPGRGFDHPLSSSAEVKERVELYLYYLSGPSWPVLG